MSANISDWNGDVKNSLTLDSPRRMLDGFPWVSAIILYTLSWGWSLLRPNTLYWDDWLFNVNGVENFAMTMRDHYLLLGRAPWNSLIELFLLKFGVWAVCFATLIGFFAIGIFTYGILQKIPKLTRSQIRVTTLLFLIIPVNHARISLCVFDYSTSYFFFFLGWLVLVRYRSLKSFIFSFILLFLSLKTHSFIFFMLIPLLHFLWLYEATLFRAKRFNLIQVRALSLAFIPITYVGLRHFFWPVDEVMGDYQKIYISGLATGIMPIFLGLLALILILLRRMKGMSTKFGWIFFVVGFLLTALALLPYFAGNFYVGYAGRPAYITVFEFRADWRSRYQILMPLGLALTVVGLNELFKFKGKNVISTAVLAISVSLNMFWGSQYFLMSHKQEQLVNLFKTTKDKIEIASVEDDTKRFNGRESTFRGYEWAGFMTLAEIPTEMPGCEALPNGSALILKSDISYLKALVTRDLGLYFKVTPCVEVLAKDG